MKAVCNLMREQKPLATYWSERARITWEQGRVSPLAQGYLRLYVGIAIAATSLTCINSPKHPSRLPCLPQCQKLQLNFLPFFNSGSIHHSLLKDCNLSLSSNMVQTTTSSLNLLFVYLHPQRFLCHIDKVWIPGTFCVCEGIWVCGYRSFIEECESLTHDDA